MRLHAYLIQAVVPGKSMLHAQLPGFSLDAAFSDGKQDLASIVRTLRESGDARAEEAQKAFEALSLLDVVDMRFKGTFLALIVPYGALYIIQSLESVS